MTVKHTFYWTSDASGNATVQSVLPISGKIQRVVLIPSTLAVPTALYDVTLNDSNGIDILATQGANLAAGTSLSIIPSVPLKDGTTTRTVQVTVDGILTLNVVNAGPGTAGRAIVYTNGSGGNTTSGVVVNQGSAPPPSAAPLDPPTGSAIWLRAQEEAYSNGANVSQWSDKSGNARHFTIGSNYPTFAVAANNGKAAIAFNGTNQGLNRTYTGSGTGWTIGAILQQDTAAFKIWWQASVDPYIGINIPSGFSVPYVYRSTAVGGSAIVPWTDWLPLAIRVSGTTAQLYMGKTLVASGAIAAGALNVLGLGNLSGYFWNGKMQEIIAYESALSDANLNIMMDYLLDQAGKPEPRVVICDGDSLTAGYGGATPWPTTMQAAVGVNYRVANIAIVGQSIVDYPGSGYPNMNTDVSTQVLPVCPKIGGFQTNIVVVWAGTNDIVFGGTGTATHTNFAAYCTACRAAGAKVVAVNMIPRNIPAVPAYETHRGTFNSLFASNAASYSDAQVTLTDDSRLTDFNDTTYFQGDKVHLTTVGNNVVATHIQTAIAGI